MPDSIFASIARGETEAHRVLERERVMAVLDIAPAARGHTILFPKEPIQVLGQLEEDVMVELFESLRLLRHATVLQDPTIEGLTSFIAQGPAAGQRAPHLLVHTIPRRRDDGLFPFEPKGRDEEAARALSDITGDRDGVLVEVAEKSRARGETLLLDRSVEIFEELDAERIGQFARILRDTTSGTYEALGAEGTNVFIESGVTQTHLGAEANVVPRWEDDGLDLSWPSSPASDLDEVASGFTKILGADREPSPSDTSSHPVKTDEKQDTRNYLFEQLKRLP